MTDPSYWTADDQREACRELECYLADAVLLASQLAQCGLDGADRLEARLRAAEHDVELIQPAAEEP